MPVFLRKGTVPGLCQEVGPARREPLRVEVPEGMTQRQKALWYFSHLLPLPRQPLPPRLTPGRGGVRPHSPFNRALQGVWQRLRGGKGGAAPKA